LILRLPEVEIEAGSKEEAEEKYMELYEKEEMGSLPEIDFEEDDKEEYEDSDEETESDEDEEEEYEEDEYEDSDEDEDISPQLIRLPLVNCKIYELKEGELPEEVLDDIEYVLYYLDKGYDCLGGISEESRIMKFKRRSR